MPRSCMVESDNAGNGDLREGKISYKRHRRNYLAYGLGFLAIVPAVLMAFVTSVWWSSMELTAEEITAENETPGLSGVVSASLVDSSVGYFIYIPKKEYFPAEIIAANISSVPYEMLDNNAVVAIRRLDAPDGGFVSREFIHKRDCTVRMRAPMKPGDYEVIGYDNGIVLNETTVSAR
ncbi:MAG: hypothetical protein LBK91_01765, partial [Synergistaceae bacterium]|nr:hypothetical protein [Synergistaceae bacterium]